MLPALVWHCPIDVCMQSLPRCRSSRRTSFQQEGLGGSPHKWIALHWHRSSWSHPEDLQPVERNSLQPILGQPCSRIAGCLVSAYIPFVPQETSKPTTNTISKNSFGGCELSHGNEWGIMLTNSCKNFYPCHKICHRMTPNLYRKIAALCKSLWVTVEDHLHPLGFILLLYGDIP